MHYLKIFERSHLILQENACPKGIDVYQIGISCELMTFSKI